METITIVLIIVIVVILIAVVFYFLTRKKDPSPSPTPSGGIQVEPLAVNSVLYETANIIVSKWTDLTSPKIVYGQYDYSDETTTDSGDRILQITSKTELNDSITISAEGETDVVIPVIFTSGNPTKISSTFIGDEMILDLSNPKAVSFEITNSSQLNHLSMESKNYTVVTSLLSAGILGQKITMQAVSSGTAHFIISATGVPTLTYNVTVKSSNKPSQEIQLSLNNIQCTSDTSSTVTIKNYSDLEGIIVKTEKASIATAQLGSKGAITLNCVADGDTNVTVSASNASGDKTISVKVGLDLANVDKYDVSDGDTSDPVRVVGYFTNWAQYRVGLEYKIDDIDIDQLTHIVYAFFPINDTYQVRYSDAWADLSLSTISKVVALKNVSKVKAVMFSIGGWTYCGDTLGKTFLDVNDTTGTMNTKTYKAIWNDILTVNSAQTAFITSVAEMMNKHSFDGVDIDLEHPVCPQNECDSSFEGQKDGYVSLITGLRNKLGSTKLISIAGAASYKVLNTGYDLENLAKQIDWFNVMTYDYHVATETYTGHNQPKRDTSDGFDINYTLFKYLDSKIPGSKLNVGLAMYTRGYIVSDSDFTNAISKKKFGGIQIKEPSAATKWLQEKGTAAQFELAETYPKANSYYIENEGSWLCDEDTKTLESYTDIQDMVAINKIRISKQIGGIMYYATDQDDYPGTITGQKNLMAESFNLVNQGTLTTNLLGANNLQILANPVYLFEASVDSKYDKFKNFTFTPRNSTRFSDYSYEMKDTSIATVNSTSGLIYSVGAGRTTLTVKAKDADSKEHTVDVPINIASEKVSIFINSIPWGYENLSVDIPAGVFPFRVMNVSPVKEITFNDTGYIYDSEKDVYWMNRISGELTDLPISWDAEVYNSTLVFSDTYIINLKKTYSDLTLSSSGTSFLYEHSDLTITLTSQVDKSPDTLENLVITSSQFDTITLKIKPCKWKATINAALDIDPITLVLATEKTFKYITDPKEYWYMKPSSTLKVDIGFLAMQSFYTTDYYNTGLVTFTEDNLNGTITFKSGSKEGVALIFYVN